MTRGPRHRPSAARRATSRLTAVVVGVVAAGVLVPSCGVPLQSQPDVIAPTSVPFDLLGQRVSKPTPLSLPQEKHDRMAVYFVEDDSLVGVDRALPAGTTRTRASVVLKALTAGPATSEQDRGLSSAIPPGLRLQLLSLHDGEVTIDISGDSGGLSARENSLTVGQIVLSLTSVPGIARVRFTRDRVPLEPPLVDGSLASGAVTSYDYAPLRKGLGATGQAATPASGLGR
jgi:hypothetical protein